MKTHVAHSDSVDALDAAKEIVASCQAAFGDTAPAAGILFASIEYEHQVLLDAFHAAWPEIQLIGCSTNGEFSNRLGFCHDSVVLTAFGGEGLVAHSGFGRDLSKDIPGAVEQATSGLEGIEPRLCVSVFAPTTNSSEVVRLLGTKFSSTLRTPCPVVGGLGGAPREQKGDALEFFGDQVLTDSLPLLFLSGDIRIGWGVGSGWFPIGEPHQVTKADGHLVYEIDGHPALDIYKKHYGAVPAQSLGEYPLAIYEDDGSDEWALRAILGSDSDSGFLRFAGEVLENSMVRMTEVLPEGILSGSAESLKQAIEGFPGESPELALIFSCAARKWVLGTEADGEVGELQRCAAEHGLPDLPIAGFYAFGEISPNRQGDQGQFHNEACVSIVIGR